EDMLDRLRAHELAFSPDIADILLASIDVMREFIAATAEGKDIPASQSGNLLHKMKAHPGLESKTARSATEAEIEHAAVSDADGGLSASRQSARTLRVDVQKLDRLLDLTGEIGIAWGRVTRLFENKERSVETLAEAHNMAGVLQAELQELVMK